MDNLTAEEKNKLRQERKRRNILEKDSSRLRSIGVGDPSKPTKPEINSNTPEKAELNEKNTLNSSLEIPTKPLTSSTSTIPSSNTDPNSLTPEITPTANTTTTTTTNTNIPETITKNTTTTSPIKKEEDLLDDILESCLPTISSIQQQTSRTNNNTTKSNNATSLPNKSNSKSTLSSSTSKSIQTKGEIDDDDLEMCSLENVSIPQQRRPQFPSMFNMPNSDNMNNNLFPFPRLPNTTQSNRPNNNLNLFNENNEAPEIIDLNKKEKNMFFDARNIQLVTCLLFFIYAFLGGYDFIIITSKVTLNR
jgi:hypothetical protein